MQRYSLPGKCQVPLHYMNGILTAAFHRLHPIWVFRKIPFIFLGGLFQEEASLSCNVKSNPDGAIASIKGKRIKFNNLIARIMRERDYHICRVEVPMYERYDKAVENNDAKELAWFAQFGTEKWENQMITNARAYEQYLLCGYKGEPVFNEHGWLENGRCIDLKEKSELVPVFKDDQYRANVMILQHPNRKWIATAEYNFSISGGGAYPSIWSKQYPTRRDALNAVLDSLISHIENSTVQKDKKYLSIIRKMRGTTCQLSLFDNFE